MIISEFKLPDAPECEVELPATLIIRDVYKRGHQFFIVAEHSPNADTALRCIKRISTGEEIPNIGAYIGSHHAQGLHFYDCGVVS